MEIIEIKKCRICGNKDLIPIMDLGIHVLSSRFPKPDESDPPAAPLALIKCNEINSGMCGLLQLQHVVPLDELYHYHYGYRSGLNITMTQHLNSLVEDIEKRVKLNSGDIVLDIGSNDATLLKAYKTKGIVNIGVDPVGQQFEHFYPKDFKFIKDYFSFSNFMNIANKRAKVITSIAMFYDLLDPMKFVYDVRESLDLEGLWVFEQSYMPLMLEKNAFDTICHEHQEYYGLKQIKWMMEKADLRIIDVLFNDINGGSFRTFVMHKNASYNSNDNKINEILSREKKLGLDTLEPYKKFNERVESLKIKLSSFLEKEKKKNKSIYIYGASTKGNTLLQYFKINPKIITAAAERNPEKFGRVTPLTRIPIISEEEARNSKPDYFLVLPWHFKEEFIEREQNFLNFGGKLIFPLPKFEIIKNMIRKI